MYRREFLAATSAVCSVAYLARPSSADSSTGSPRKPWLRKTLKFNMIGEGKTFAEKFAIAKEAGFEGVEMHLPFEDIKMLDDANAAAKKTGLIIDGSVGNYHWKIRHTDPDPAVREEALKNLKEALRQTAVLGGDTMLVVPGHGKDGTSKEVLARSVEAIRAALPVAKETGVTIVIENVWNEMFYAPDGGSDQTADELAAFIDQFDSPLVGTQYDIGNHWKYGDPAGWIRTLGPRITKLDIKGFSRAEDKFTDITKGDLPWKGVEAALREIGFKGWLAAEVKGGNLERLREVSQHLDAALNCGVNVAEAVGG